MLPHLRTSGFTLFLLACNSVLLVASQAERAHACSCIDGTYLIWPSPEAVTPDTTLMLAANRTMTGGPEDYDMDVTFTDATGAPVEFELIRVLPHSQDCSSHYFWVKPKLPLKEGETYSIRTPSTPSYQASLKINVTAGPAPSPPEALPLHTASLPVDKPEIPWNSCGNPQTTTFVDVLVRGLAPDRIHIVSAVGNGDDAIPHTIAEYLEPGKTETWLRVGAAHQNDSCVTIGVYDQTGVELHTYDTCQPKWCSPFDEPVISMATIEAREACDNSSGGDPAAESEAEGGCASGSPSQWPVTAALLLMMWGFRPRRAMPKA